MQMPTSLDVGFISTENVTQRNSGMADFSNFMPQLLMQMSINVGRGFYHHGKCCPERLRNGKDFSNVMQQLLMHMSITWI